MTILVIAKLTPEKLMSKLRPFIDNPKVEHIYILRDQSFETDNTKIIFLPNPKIKGILRHFEKIRIAKRFAKYNHIDIIISYLLPPHGYMGWVLSKMLKSKWIHAIIAGHREIWMNGTLMKKVNLLLLRSADVVNVMGKNTSDYLVRNGINKKKIVEIPNAIDGDLFQPVFKRNVIYDVIYASRIDENKNFPLLINAVERLKPNFPNIKVCVAGDGNKLKDVIGLCHHKGLDANFLFLGMVGHDIIRELYSQSRIFVLTSRGEGVPMSLLEAMFCGMACISTNVGEIGNIIKDGENGILLQNTNDDEQLADDIGRLLTDKELYERISRNAIGIKSNYSFAHVTMLWDKAFSAILK